MASSNTTYNLSSSPPSGGTRTNHGTPSTNATFMSPDTGTGYHDNGSSIPVFDLGKEIRDVPMPQSLNERRHVLLPPVNTMVTIEAEGHVGSSLLSGAAEEFKPTPRAALFPGHGRTGQQNPGVIGSGPPAAVQRGAVYNVGIFTTEETMSTRAFLVTGFTVRNAIAYEFIGQTYKNFSSLANINASSMSSNGVFSVEFHDHAEAKQALELTFKILCDVPVQCYWLLPKDIAQANGTPSGTVSDHVAEYIVNLVHVGAAVTQITPQSVFEICASMGLVKAFRTLPTEGNAHMSFRVEWSDARINATRLSAAVLAGYRVIIKPYTPDIVEPASVNGFGRPVQRFDSDAHTRNVMSFLQPPTPSRGAASTSHNVVDLVKILLGQDVRTTIMLRNIPNRVDQASLKKLLDETSKGMYDFMYLRIDFANNCNVGYAFINFVDPMAIVPFAKARAGQKWNLFQSDKVAEISYATIQGRDCLIQKFRNSSVMLERNDFRPKLYKTGKGPEAGEEEGFPQSDNSAKLKRSCDNAEHVGLYHPAYPQTPGKPQLLLGPIVAPPRHQRAGGRYAQPAQGRVATIYNKAFYQDFAQVEGYHQQNLHYLTPPPSEGTDSPTSLYAPREGQAYRERQRRQFSQFDRGTSLAQSELANMSHRLGTMTSPTSSTPSYGRMPVNLPIPPSSIGYGNSPYAVGLYASRRNLPIIDTPCGTVGDISSPLQHCRF